jgi:ATP-binding cassette, subfamily F, member 3
LLAAKTEAPREGRKMGASLQAQKRSGDLVVEARRLDVGFVEGGTETRLVRELDWTVRRGEKWGVVGQNGAGKSSLIRTLLGRQAALGGEARLGANVEAGYFAQDAGEFDPDDSPLEVIVDVCGFKPPEARDLLGRYLFSGEDVFRPVRTFSGGERNKLALAALTGLNPNLLVLDEPTNHLDMDSREALAGVLREYNGTLLLVSHDRWLLGAVTNRTLDVRRDGVREFPGSYAEYRRRAEMAQAKPSRTSSTDRKPNAGLTPRELSKEIQRLAKQVEEREKAVAHAEAALREIEAQLASPSPGDDLHAQTLRHAELEADLAAKLESWEQDAHRLEELRAMQRACGSVESVP